LHSLLAVTVCKLVAFVSVGFVCLLVVTVTVSIAAVTKKMAVTVAV
jgi:hypothetical protein